MRGFLHLIRAWTPLIWTALALTIAVILGFPGKSAGANDFRRVALVGAQSFIFSKLTKITDRYVQSHNASRGTNMARASRLSRLFKAQRLFHAVYPWILQWREEWQWIQVQLLLKIWQ
jgi:hypothetical protein